jgi:hypothetical protein
MNWQEMKEHRQLCHDGGKLLRFLVDRLSIPRDRWICTYCFKGVKKSIPTKKKERIKFLSDNMQQLGELIRINRPCAAVVLGQLGCECFTGASRLDTRSDTCWPPNRFFREMGLKRIWVASSPDAALFDPVLCVSISRVIGKAAIQAGIEVKMNYDLEMFNFSQYQSSN